MKNELENHYNEVQRVLDILPTNTKANKKKKLNFLVEQNNINNNNIDLILEEIKKRLSVFNDIKHNLEIDDMINELKQYTEQIDNSIYSTPYEKMHLDYYLLRIKESSNEDLNGVNENLRKVVKTFKDSGILLKPEDYNFSKYAKDYMTLVINNKNDEELKNKFEEIYWKFPNLIATLITNTMSIYIRNEKKLTKFYTDLVEEYKKR